MYRWVWKREDGYTSTFTHGHADGHLRHLARRECSNAHKNACRKAVMISSKWRHHQRGAEKWELDLSFSRTNQSTAPREYLTRDERTKISDASLEYGSIPNRESVSGEERDRWEAYLALRDGIVDRISTERTGVTQAATVADDLIELHGFTYPSLSP